MTNQNLLYLQVVDLAERCFLKEVLLWRAFRRLPVFIPGEKGDARFSYDYYEYQPFFEDYPITDTECAFAGLRISPEYQCLINNEYILSVAFYDGILSRDGLLLEDKEMLMAERERAVEHEKDVLVWREEYESFIDYCESG